MRMHKLVSIMYKINEWTNKIYLFDTHLYYWPRIWLILITENTAPENSKTEK